jgi:hypothetical protein
MIRTPFQERGTNLIYAQWVVKLKSGLDHGLGLMSFSQETREIKD